MESQGTEIPKQYLGLTSRSVLECSLAPFIAHPGVAGIVVVLAAGDRHWQRLPVAAHAKIETVTGGAERADSVFAGLEFLRSKAKADDWVLVHDAARPCLHEADLERMIRILSDEPAGGLMALPARDTLKRADDGHSVDTLDRRNIWQAQTPQMFRIGLLHEAMAAALQAGLEITDESSAMEQAGYRPRLVEGRASNIKITVSEDLVMAGLILGQRGVPC